MTNIQDRLKNLDESLARIQAKIADGEYTPEQINEISETFTEPMEEKINQLEDLYKEQDDNKGTRD